MTAKKTTKKTIKKTKTVKKTAVKPSKKTAVKKKIVKKTATKKKQQLTVPGIPTLGSANKRLIAATLKAEEERIARQNLIKGLTFEELNDAVIGSSTDFYYVLHELRQRSKVPLKMKLGQRWYPVTLSDYYTRQLLTGGMVSMNVIVNLYDVRWERYPAIYDSDFKDALGKHINKKFYEVLAEAGLAVTSPKDLEEHIELLQKATSYRNDVGKSLEVNNTVLEQGRWFFGPRLVEMPFGTAKYPRVGLVEPELELTDTSDSYGDEEANEMALPFLRLFSLDYKRYIYADIRDVKPHQYIENAVEKLVLPTELKTVITDVFQAEDVFGDLFAGRHGGMVVLANGAPGIGKTLTAEVFAEQTKRPLYVLEMGELGVQLDKVEEALQLIFARAARWNAVLLFDEVDIFLSKRTEADLERNAIVGVFLRLLDQYKGMLFLTTNRADAIDPAFSSRITLRLDYPNLTKESRGRIWSNMLQSAGLTLGGGDLVEITDYKLNGRQIRNVTRLLKATAKGSYITVSDVKKYVKYSPIIE